MKSKKTLSSWLTNRYLLIIRNEENFAEKTTLSFNYARIIATIVTGFVVLMLISLYLVKTILSQWFDPHHANMENNRKLIELSMAVDSLATQVEQKDRFIANFQGIIQDDTLVLESEIQRAPLIEASSDEIDDFREYNLSAIDSQFRKEFEESGIGVLPGNESTDFLHEIFFFSPISGIVSSKYNAKKEHFGVDVVSKKNEPVKCIADGTVIFSDWTQETGNVIAVQHRDNLISVYKHNSGLLKKVGNFVNAGDIISIIGNTGELTDGPHLHFEVWYNGNPVNPEEFVTF